MAINWSCDRPDLVRTAPLTSPVPFLHHEKSIHHSTPMDHHMQDEGEVGPLYHNHDQLVQARGSQLQPEGPLIRISRHNYGDVRVLRVSGLTTVIQPPGVA